MNRSCDIFPQGPHTDRVSNKQELKAVTTVLYKVLTEP